MSVREYVIVIEKAGRTYGAYAPDLPGCVAVAGTRKEAEVKMRSAIQFHLEGLREDGLPIPRPTSSTKSVRVMTPPVVRRAARQSGRTRRQVNGKRKSV